MPITAPLHFTHRLDRSGHWRHLLGADQALDVLEHDDCVVNDDADRQHHREQRQRVDREAEQPQPANVPTSETGTASIGISVARHVCRNTNTTSSTMTAASRMVNITSLIDAETNRVVSYGIE
jgi:hypothetical protein